VIYSATSRSVSSLRPSGRMIGSWNRLNHAIGHQNKTPLGIAERGLAGVLKLR
jgi:hypothetical protein